MAHDLIEKALKGYEDFQRAKEAHIKNIEEIDATLSPLIYDEAKRKLGSDDIEMFSLNRGGCLADNWEMGYAIVSINGFSATTSFEWQSFILASEEDRPRLSVAHAEMICSEISKKYGVKVELHRRD